MKEIWLFTLSSSVDETVQELGELGVVEIKQISEAQSLSIDSRRQNVQRAETAISILKSIPDHKTKSTNRQKYNSIDPARITKRIHITRSILKECQHRLEELEQQFKWYNTWGKNLDFKDFRYLESKGVFISLYLVKKSFLDKLPEIDNLIRFEPKGQLTPVALFSRDRNEKLDHKEEELPELSLEEIKRQIARKHRQLQEVEFYLRDQAENIDLLYDYRAYLKDGLNTQLTLEGMGDIEGSIKYLKGFVPHDKVDLIEEKAKEKNWGYQIIDPENPEEVPVKIKTPKWVSIINPVLKFIDIVPGYKEVDVSIYFLVAFALFFAMLVGDAGYGALFLIATVIFRKKLSPQVQFLIYVLSGATIIWGILSGTYFGSEYIASFPFLEQLIIPQISSFGVDNISFMMHLSFLIGAIHLTIAHIVRVIQFINSIKALSEIGWIAFTWGLFFVAEKLVLGKELPEWNTWLFVLGFALVTFFSKEGKNLVNSVLISIGNLPLSLINGFSDIVSYVRLFAVGMATATVASSFNSMIIPTGVDISIVQIIMAAIALLLGHGLNIILALMAVMVHGIRLNMLEFAGHLGVQFSGEAYKPFKLSSTSKEYTEDQ